jgi:O-antigen ligase
MTADSVGSSEELQGGRATFRPLPLHDLLEKFTRWLIWCAVLLTMTTARIAIGSIHVNSGDLIGGAASLCFLASWVLARSKRIELGGAVWPSVVVSVAAVSAAGSARPDSAALGLVELTVLWVLPSLIVPNVVSTQRNLERFLTCVSIGSLIAGGANLVRAFQLGLGGAGGLPQVWGAAQYFQGYFQLIALIIAIWRLSGSIGARKVLGALLWLLACLVNATALLLTQTRGAWLAAVVAMIVLGVLWRPSFLIGTVIVLVTGAAVLARADWADVVRQRVQSIFTLEAGLSGFESSLGRLGLAVTAWRMFSAHPLLGVGLKNFTSQLPVYAPPGMPLAYDMGPDHVLTQVEGPHSTYLSLLSEVGVVGLIGLLCWQFGAMRRLYREMRRAQSMGAQRGSAPAMFAAVWVVVIYNCFFELNQTGTLLFVCLLALAWRTRREQLVG